MGQLVSKSASKPTTPHVLNDRIQESVQDAIPNLLVSTATHGSQTHMPHQNQASIDGQVPFISMHQRRDSNRAPSSNGYYTSTVVDPDGSPVSCKPVWNNVAHVNLSNRHTSPLEDDFGPPCHVSGGQAFRRHPRKTGLEIICPHLNRILRNITNPSTACQGDTFFPRLSIDRPYELVLHNRQSILQMDLGNIDDDIDGHIRALFGFIQKEDRHAWEKLYEIEERKCREIAFKDLWLLYPPGKTVFNRDGDAWRAFKVDRVEVHSNQTLEKMTIHCLYLDFNKTGQLLVPQAKVFHTSSYSSDRSIQSLDLIPDWYYGQLKERLIGRGRLYWSYGHRVFHKRYDGNAWPRMTKEEPVNVIIDYVTSSKHQQDAELDELQCTGARRSICQGNTVQLQSYPTNAPHDSDICEAKQTATTYTSVDLLMFCPHQLWAFSLRHKSWKMVAVGELSEIQQNDEPFERLQMDKDKKTYLESFLRGYLETRELNNNLDLIKGKGRCLNVLMHGNPGTGKTLTVESLCQKHRIPLYILTCGELGNDTDAFEDRLQRAFLRAGNWEAVLLLEEADIFVREKASDIQHYSIVSSFLGKLDYSRAAVFMATTGPKVFNEALKSRLHMALPFPDFDFPAQKEIWKDSINRLEHISEDDKEALRHWVGSQLESADERRYTRMNGTQIRNCISAASVLARGNREDRSFKYQDILKILRLGEDFREYLCTGDNADSREMSKERRRQGELRRMAMSGT